MHGWTQEVMLLAFFSVRSGLVASSYPTLGGLSGTGYNYTFYMYVL